MAQRQLYSGLDLYDWRGTGPNGRTKAVDVDKWQQNQEDIRHLPGAFPVQSVVITDGQITPTAAALSVDTEGGAPADDLTAIAPGDLHAGMLLALCSVDAGRKVTIKNSAGASGIQTLDGKDVVLDTQYAVMLRLVSTESLTLWREEPGPLRLQLTVSTPDTLGGVKVQTGDDDGLEMIGDKLRVRQANATQRGSVLASETAQAGVVPVGGADGTLGEDWLKKAMDAADRAQTTADEAIEAIPSAATYSKISVRSSTGNWTITGCTIGKPLKIYLTFTKQQGDEGNWGSADLITVSGAEMGYIYESQAFTIGNGGAYASSNIFEIIPTSTNVLNVYNLSSPAKLLAYN